MIFRKHLAPPVLALALATGCAGAHGRRTYQDPNMDFGSIHTIAVLPFENLSRDSAAADRVQEVFSDMLLATGAVYVVPPGEMARAVSRLAVVDPHSPSVEEVVKIGGLVKADAVLRGVVKEYGEVRSGAAVGNVVSVSLALYETSTGKVVWSASSTKGGIGFGDRLLGGGGEPMDGVTEQVADDLIAKLFR